MWIWKRVPNEVPAKLSNLITMGCEICCDVGYVVMPKLEKSPSSPRMAARFTPLKCRYSIEAGRGGKASFLTEAAERVIGIDSENADGPGS